MRSHRFAILAAAAALYGWYTSWELARTAAKQQKHIAKLTNLNMYLASKLDDAGVEKTEFDDIALNNL